MSKKKENELLDAIDTLETYIPAPDIDETLKTKEFNINRAKTANQFYKSFNDKTLKQPRNSVNMVQLDSSNPKGLQK